MALETFQHTLAVSSGKLVLAAAADVAVDDDDDEDPGWVIT